ncbi:hypothetical protein ACNF49_07825 [Actinomadura sp. ATCC 39365]
MTASGQLVAYCATDFFNFRDYPFAESLDHGFRWINLKHFDLLNPTASDADLVHAVIQHDQFRDDYAGGGVDPAGTRHGHYWLQHITTQAYEPVGIPTVIATIASWAHQYGDVPQPLQNILETEIFDRIRQATARYQLKDLGEDCYHDYGRVHQDFHEVITINRTNNTLALIVAADD